MPKKQDYIDNLPPQKHSATLQVTRTLQTFIWLTASFIKVNFGCFRHHIAFNEAQHGGLRCQGSVGPEDREMGSLVIGSGAFQNSSLAQKFSWMLSWESCSSKLPSHWVQFQAVSRILLKKKTDAIWCRCYTKRLHKKAAQSRSTSPSPMPMRRLRLWDPKSHVGMGTDGDYWTMLTMLTMFAILRYFGNLGMPKSAHTALAVKACLLGGKTATLNAQWHLLI